MTRKARLLRWPSERDERPAVVAGRQPCVWLVEPSVAPPDDWEEWEDWVRLPSDEGEIAARIAGVEARRGALDCRAWIDDADILRHGDSWVALSPLEGRLMKELLHREREVVRRHLLIEAAWPSADDRDSPDLNTAMKSLRRKAESVQVGIHTIAGRGYLAEVVPPAR